MIQIVYQWEVPAENQAAFFAAWEETTLSIRESTEGALGSFCVVSVDTPTEILTIAKWERLEQWQDFINGANLTSMRAMHELGTQVSTRAYVQKGDFTT
ncbi:MAG: antibiotic biosynthesis monooxygenase [Woeseiaceae bacterium]|nr:antibiotic biosynthesis monooxygenase [Woeseiaceae bacterium]